MKKINFSNLSFQEGKSDKVYEVDLVEQMSRESERYYVNFRYGRRGANLREGTKTTQPVSLEQAEQLFDSVIVSKVNKGYIVASGHNPLEDVQFDTATSIELDVTTDFTQQQDIVYRHFLNSRNNKSESGRSNRLIWRLGELAMVDAVPALLETLQSTKPKEEFQLYPLCR